MYKRNALYTLLAGITICVCGSFIVYKLAEISSAGISDKVTIPLSYTLENNGTSPGFKIIGALHCLNCHREKEALSGPSFESIANRYNATESNMELLAGRITNGCKGRWGQTAMPAYSGLNIVDANEIALFILSLKKDNKADSTLTNK